MTRTALVFTLICRAGSAQAHPGHLIELAGHDHWVAGAAIGLAILLGIRGALKGKPQDEDDEKISEEELEGKAA